MHERARKVAEQRKPMAFHDAVVHLAFNLGDMEHTLENVRDTVTVQLVADIYHVDAELLARCIMRQRANHNYGASD